MRYKEFRSIVKSKVKRIDLTDRVSRTFLRTAYDSLPKGLNLEQQKAYAEVWAAGYQAGRLEANISSRELLSGLGRKIS